MSITLFLHLQELIFSSSPQIIIVATATNTIFIGDNQLHPYYVEVEQRTDWHNRFKIMVRTENAGVMGDTENEIIENALANVGRRVEISFERPAGIFNFKGYVNDVQIDHTYAGDSFIIFKGYSPTYLLEGRKSVASFEDKKLADIFNEVNTTQASSSVRPVYTKKIPYVVRYKETAYQFLSRLADTYGEWFYYDGQEIVFGEIPKGSPKVDLHFGSDSMLSYNYGMNLRPSKFKNHFYEEKENNILEESVSIFKPGWLDYNTNNALETSNRSFPEEAIDPVSHLVFDSKHIKHLAETKKASILTDMAVFTAHSSDPSVIVGAEIKVNSQKGFIGEFRVIYVSHILNSHNDYRNMFRAIPIKNVAPPMNRNIINPKAHSQVGIVTDNEDPDKLGRIRVQLKWQEAEKTPWIRVQTNHAGKDRGTYFIPEIDDEVMVEFEHNNPDRPYVIGSMYHGKIGPEFSDPDNNFKAIKTRSGHKILFNDKDGEESITIIDKKNNQIILNTKEESITISAPKKLLIESEEIEMKGKNITISASGDLTEKGKNVTIGAKSNLELNGDAGVAMTTNGKVDISGKAGLSAVSDGPAEVGGKAMLKLQTSGIATIQGSLVKIN